MPGTRGGSAKDELPIPLVDGRPVVILEPEKLILKKVCRRASQQAAGGRPVLQSQDRCGIWFLERAASQGQGSGRNPCFGSTP